MSTTTFTSGPSAPLAHLRAGVDFADPEHHWAEVGEIAADGALLVRPDQHVAWRAMTLPEDPGRALREAMDALALHPRA